MTHLRLQLLGLGYRKVTFFPINRGYGSDSEKNQPEDFNRKNAFGCNLFFPRIVKERDIL
jgi:hypothetical protein